MTDTPARDEANHGARLTALETGLRHFQDICDLRNQQVRDTFVILQQQNERQDRERQEMEKRLQDQLEELNALLWSGMKWLGSFLGVTLCTIVLKALRLV
jgi:hypothetical protein